MFLNSEDQSHIYYTHHCMTRYQRCMHILTSIYIYNFNAFKSGMMTLFAASSLASTAASFLVRATMAAAPTVFVHCFGLLSGFCIFFFRFALPLAPGHVGCARRVIAASSLVGTHCATVQRHAGCTWTCACTFVPAFCRAAVAARCLEDVDFRMACAHVYAHATTC